LHRIFIRNRIFSKFIQNRLQGRFLYLKRPAFAWLFNIFLFPVISKYLSFETMEFSLNDFNYCIRLMLDFPFACNHEDETMLSDFLIEHYEMPDEAWFKELGGELDEDGEEVDPSGGTELEVKINQKVSLFVEYNPFETVYFFNDTYLGNSGGHFHLSLLTWNEFSQIIRGREHESGLFFLLLPLVVGSKNELPVIKTEIEKRLKELPFKQEHIPIIAKYLGNHCVFDDDENDMFLEDPKKGTICKRNHSQRNPATDTQELINVNVAILSAMEP
jgi:hypothetical protein